MYDNDNIEELFRSKAKGLEEKPNDLVWNKIESKLNTKKIHPIREFTQSVWFSAAVYAMIAIPYFVIFLIKENEKKEIHNTTTPQVVMEMPVINNSNTDTIFSTSTAKEPLYTSDEKNIEIVKNEPIVNSQPKQENLKATPSLETVTPMSARVMKTETTLNDFDTNSSDLKIKFLDDRFLVVDSIQNLPFTLFESTDNTLIFSYKSLTVNLIQQDDSIVVELNQAVDSQLLKIIEKNKSIIYQKFQFEND